MKIIKSSEKEKGIIGQEIMMYDDYPDWIVYMNALKAMYKNTPINIDITRIQHKTSHLVRRIF